MASGDRIPVEVVAATPEIQVLVSLSVPAGTTARQSLGLAGIAEKVSGLDASQCPLAIWGAPVADHHVLQANDRVEVLRPLVMNPRDARRKLAIEGQVMGVSTPARD